MITSLENKQVKELTKLHLKKYREDKFLLLDESLILKAKEANKLVQLIYVDELPFEFNNCLEVSQEVLNKIAKQYNLKYIGVGSTIIEKEAFSNRIMILDHLQDPLNIGRIMESAQLFGFESIILSDECADIYNEKCLNNCKGGLYSLNIYHCDLIDEVKKLQDKGYMVYATGLRDNTKELHEVKPKEKMAFILGNEGAGVCKELMDLADEIVKIDMCNIDSLNVGMAGAIVMHQFSI